MDAKITVELVQGAGGVDFGELPSREVEAATVGALNRTVKNVQVEASQQIRQELNLPAGVVKQILNLRRQLLFPPVLLIVAEHLKTRNAMRRRQVAGCTSSTNGRACATPASPGTTPQTFMS